MEHILQPSANILHREAFPVHPTVERNTPHASLLPVSLWALIKVCGNFCLSLDLFIASLPVESELHEDMDLVRPSSWSSAWHTEAIR